MCNGVPAKCHVGYYANAIGGARMIVIEPMPVHQAAVVTRGNRAQAWRFASEMLSWIGRSTIRPVAGSSTETANAQSTALPQWKRLER